MINPANTHQSYSKQVTLKIDVNVLRRLLRQNTIAIEELDCLDSGSKNLLQKIALESINF